MQLGEDKTREVLQLLDSEIDNVSVSFTCSLPKLKSGTPIFNRERGTFKKLYPKNVVDFLLKQLIEHCGCRRNVLLSNIRERRDLC